EAESRSDWQSAESDYLKAIAISPGWAEAMVNLGIVYNRQGKSDQAARAFTRAAEINPQLFGAHLNLAITCFRARRFVEAEAPLRRALAIEPSNDQVSRLLVLTLFALDRHEEAAELAAKVLIQVPDDAALLEVAGRADMKLHRFGDAVRVFEKLSKILTENPETYMLLGEARDNAGDSEAAIGDLRRAIAIGGRTPLAEAHYALGYILWKLRRYSEAEAEFRAELQRDPDHAPSIYYLGNIAFSRKEWPEAIAFLERATRAMPEDFESHYDLGKALLQTGVAERAMAE